MFNNSDICVWWNELPLIMRHPKAVMYWNSCTALNVQNCDVISQKTEASGTDSVDSQPASGNNVSSSELLFINHQQMLPSGDVNVQVTEHHIQLPRTCKWLIVIGGKCHSMVGYLHSWYHLGINTMYVCLWLDTRSEWYSMSAYLKSRTTDMVVLHCLSRWHV